MTLKSEFKELFDKQQELIDTTRKLTQLATSISKNYDSKVLIDLVYRMEELFKKLKPTNVHTWKENHEHLEGLRVLQEEFNTKYKGIFTN